MSKVLSSEDLTPTINLARCSDGYWLHDTTRGMNLSMRAKTPTEAFIEALTYYQNDCQRWNKHTANLKLA